MSDNDCTEQIEIDFLASWDRVEKFFTKHPILPLVKALRERGYDRQTRAGQSLYTFIVSRSRYRSILRGQAYIRFCAGGNFPMCSGDNTGMEVIISDGVNRTTQSFDTTAFNDKIKVLIEELIKHPITNPRQDNP